ncbi:hypothetical protein BX661DRAFT_205320 [Kickxella alabastrina]|uniref:uncharacterized protein n=1 Tax=Kickxella alabastrina TaxID=61397 RepID=UPI002220CC50|nr:uncharacterized protein BX661DRAFT_205320 [Kickxella alabastrina]KAI7827707.1 hypothetical protein BX661DRAFT_205320 [Kickxella alabastrina]KAJ1947094.1 hypothetical protein GGF37_000679 [Kickxella alabastrina]
MDFTARRFVLPECHSVPRSKFTLDEDSKHKPHSGKRQHQNQIENPVYQNVKRHEHTKSLAELTHLSKTFSEPEVWHDRQLLLRIFYRNWNQHQNSIYFRRLYELRRALRVLESTRIREMCTQLLTAFYDSSSTAYSNAAQSNHHYQIKVARKKVYEGGPWLTLPCQHHMTAVAGRLAQIARLVSKLQTICCNVYIHFTAQMAQTLFMPLALVVQGISARLYMLFDTWFCDLKAIYELLLEWLPSLPACPDSLVGTATRDMAALLLHPEDLRLPSPLAKEKPQVVVMMAKSAEEKRPSADGPMECDDDSMAVLDDDEYEGTNKFGKQKKKNKQHQQQPKKKRARDLMLDLYE